MFVSNISFPYLGKWSKFTNIFQLGWIHQLVFSWRLVCGVGFCWFVGVFWSGNFWQTWSSWPLYLDFRLSCCFVWRCATRCEMVVTENKNTSLQTLILIPRFFFLQIYSVFFISSPFLSLSPGDVRPTAPPEPRMRKVSWASFVTSDLHLVVADYGWLWWWCVQRGAFWVEVGCKYMGVSKNRGTPK